MNNLLERWKQYILKNHPVLWMTGFHLVVPLLIPVIILGFLWGYYNDFTMNIETLFIVNIIIVSISLITIVAWQYFRFMKEVTLQQLYKYFAICILIYFFTILAAFSPLKGFEQKIDDFFSKNNIANSQDFITNQILDYKIYILAKGLKPFYDENKCYFNEWLDRKFLDIYWTDSRILIKSIGNCPINNHNFEEYIFNITKELSVLNFDDPLLNYSNYLNDTDLDGVFDTYDLCVDLQGSQDNYGCPITNKPIISEVTIEELMDKIQKVRFAAYGGNEKYYDEIFSNSIANIERSANLVINNKLDSLENTIVTSKLLPSTFEGLVAKLVDPGTQLYYRYSINEIFNKMRSNAYSNESFKRDHVLLYTILIMLVLVSVISSLIVTSRFKVEAMVSPLVGFILWILYVSMITELFNIRGDELYLFIIVLPIIVIFLYWIRNCRLKSITVFRSLLLHISNLSLITILFFIWLWNNDDIIFENESLLAIILAGLALSINFLFLRQYHKHMHLPINVK